VAIKDQTLISNVQRYSVNDGPGIRTNVFIMGCPLRCAWCHNPENIHASVDVYWKRTLCKQCGLCFSVCPKDAILPPVPVDEAMEDDSTYHKIDRAKCDKCMKCVEVCPYSALSKVGDTVSVKEVLDEVERDAPFYANSGGGMTVTGGEPTTQPEYLLELLEKGKERGLHICLDTSGYSSWDVLEKTMKYVDMYLYDLKHMDTEEHKRMTGVGNELVLENLRKLSEANQTIRIRVPVVPDFNDSLKNMREMAEFLVKLPNPVQGVDLLPFHNWCQDKYRWLDLDWSLRDLESMDPSELEDQKELIESYGLQCTIGG